MTNYLQTELQRCYNLFALCYARNAPVPPDWIQYYDKLQICTSDFSVELPIRPKSENYPCDWCPAWEGWMTLVKMDLASAVMRYISTLPQEEQTLARIEIEKSRWWFRTNQYFIKMITLFKWTEDQIDYFFATANKMTKDV